MSDAETEDRVRLDMQQQEEWMRILTPHASMLKFRLPYGSGSGNGAGSGSSSTLDGVTYLPVWGGATTSETRYVVLRDAVLANRRRQWNHAQYEDQMFYFNTVTRTAMYQWPHEQDGAQGGQAQPQPAATSNASVAALALSHGLDHCFDCCSELLVLTQYLQQRWTMQHDDRSKQPHQPGDPSPSRSQPAIATASTAVSMSANISSAASQPECLAFASSLAAPASCPVHACPSSAQPAAADLHEAPLVSGSSPPVAIAQLIAMSEDISRRISSTGRSLRV